MIIYITTFMSINTNSDLIEIDLSYLTRIDYLPNEIENDQIKKSKFSFIKNYLKEICVIHSIISFILGISSILVGAYIFNPDYIDPIGLNIASYVFYNGAVDITGSVITFVIGCIYADVGKTRRGIWIWAIIRVSFGISWFIVGSIILYRSNLELIQSGSVITSYGIFVWCFNIISGFTI